MSKFVLDQWVYCPNGSGFRHERGTLSAIHQREVPSHRERHFKQNSVGQIMAIGQDIATVWLIGTDESWDISVSEIKSIDLLETGDKFQKKICNICHCLLGVENFDRNQTNKHGVVRRPSCRKCRTDIDKRAPKSAQAKAFEKNKPKIGTAFKCPICQKRSIVGVTAKIVADHNHHTGDIRDFICDSCNTGLGRFKNGHDCLKDALSYLEERDK